MARQAIRLSTGIRGHDGCFGRTIDGSGNLDAAAGTDDLQTIT